MRLPLALALLAALAVAATAAAAVPSAGPPLVRFAGLDAGQLPGVNPADVQVTAGAGVVVETVNSSIAIWRPDGTQLRQESLGALFSGSGVDRSRDDMTDPRVLWDQVSGRFFAAVFDISRGELDVAVSTSADPTGAWTVVALPSSGCPDQPRLGTSDAVVVVTDDLFSSCRGFGRFLGGEIFVLSKQDMLAGSTAPRRSSFGPDSRFAAVTPVQSLGSTPTEYLVAVEQSGGQIQLLHVDGPDVTSLPVTALPLQTPLQNPPQAPQLQGARPVDSGDDRVQNAIWEGGRIWLTADSACGGVACGRVLQLDPVAARLVRDTTIQLPAGRFLVYPAVAPDARGNAVLGFVYSSPTDFPGLGWTYVRPDGEVAPPADLAAGSAPNDSGRFGDYSGAARDPSDPTRVWLAAEIGQASDGTTQGWGSQIAAVSVPPQAPAVASTSAAASGAGSATVTAELFPEGQPTTYRVEYGATAAYGAQTPAAADGGSARSLPLTIAVTGLQPGRLYHFRVVATSQNGTTAGPDATARTPAAAPAVSSRPALRTAAGAVLRALVSPRGAATTVVFQYGSAGYGARTGARRLPAVAGPTLVSVPVRLVHGGVYRFRAVATNAAGRTVGSARITRG